MVTGYRDLNNVIGVVGSEITDRAITFLPHWQNTDTTSLTYAVMDAVCRELDLFLIKTEDAQNRHWVETSRGADLDRIGALIGLFRYGGEYDDDYRRRLMTYVPSFIGGGTKLAIQNGFGSNYGIDPLAVEVWDITPVPRFMLLINVLDIDDQILAGMTWDSVENLIKRIKAAGVGYIWFFMLDPSEISPNDILLDDSFDADVDIIPAGVAQYDIDVYDDVTEGYS